MKIERDWMDYANLVSSVLQQGQLAEIQTGLDEIKKVQIRGLQLTASIQEREELKAAIRKNNQNALFIRIRGLKEITPKLSEANPLHTFIFLHKFDLPYSPQELEDWDDKQRASDFAGELETLKSQFKSKLLPSQVEDAEKAIVAERDLESLNRLIVMDRLFDEHLAKTEQIESAINELKQKQKSSGFFASIADGLGEKIAKKESEQSDNVLNGPFISLSDNTLKVQSLLGVIELTEREGVHSVAEDLRNQLERERRSQAKEMESDHHELVRKFITIEDKFAYRLELIEAVKRCFGMGSVKEVEDYILGEDSSFKLGEIKAHIPQPYLKLIRVLNQRILSLSPQPMASPVPTAPQAKPENNHSNTWKEFVLHPAIIWLSRILGIFGMLGSIQLITNALKGTAKSDDPGLGQAIFIFLVFTSLVVHGFWRRKNNQTQVKPASENLSDEFRVKSPWFFRLIAWICIIFGALFCLMGIFGAVQFVNGPKNENEPGLMSYVSMVIVFGSMTLFGFWLRKRKAKR